MYDVACPVVFTRLRVSSVLKPRVSLCVCVCLIHAARADIHVCVCIHAARADIHVVHIAHADLLTCRHAGMHTSP